MRVSRGIGVGIALIVAGLHVGAGVAAAQSLQWARTYQGPLFEGGTGAAVSPDGGSIYVVGGRCRSFFDERCGGLARKISADGVLAWSKGFPFHLRGVAVARDGSVYAAGTRWTTGGSVAILRKMGPDGAEIWQRELPSTGGTGSSTGLAVAVNPAGTVVWVGGSERTTAGWDARLAKYTAGGEHVWSGRYHAPTGNECAVAGLDLDREGNVYVAGHAVTDAGDNVTDGRALVAKFTRGGALVWARYLPLGPDRMDYAYDVVVGPDGSLYVAADRAWADFDAVLWKLSPAAGKVLWRRVVDSGEDDNFVGVAVRPGGDEVCAVGGGPYISATPAAVVACFSFDGQKTWERSYPSPASDLAMGAGVALARDGSTYLAGMMRSAGASALDFWVAKYR